MSGSHQIEIFGVASGIVGIRGWDGAVGYGVRTAERVILVDPVEGLERGDLPLGYRSVEAILVTHAQREHFAGAAGFESVPVWLDVRDLWIASTNDPYEIEPWTEPWDWAARGNARGQVAGARNERPFRIEPRRLRGIDEAFAPPGIRVLPTPGHGKHALTFLLDHETGTIAFCGDLVCADGKLWNWYDCDWDYGAGLGPQALIDSARNLASLSPALCLPSHGPPIQNPGQALGTLIERIEDVQVPPGAELGPSINFPDQDSPAEGFRQLTPRIHQWRTGNTIVVLSGDGHGTVIDDGLCLWMPWENKVREHDRIFRNAFDQLGVEHLDRIILTHYHGDHVDLAGHLSRTYHAPIATIPRVAGILEHPDQFNLACKLPWYGTPEPTLHVDEWVPEGTRMPWRGTEFEWFHLGGQTAHHLGLNATIDGLRVVFVGDAWFGTSPEPANPLCWNDAPPEASGWLFALKQLIDRAPDLLVAGHGSALRNPLPILDEARRSWVTRLANFRALNPHPSEIPFFRPSNVGREWRQ